MIKLSPTARMDFSEVYKKYPEAIKTLSSYPGEIGELAKLSLNCAGVET